AVEHAGGFVLPGDAGRGIARGAAGGVQHRPRRAVHGAGVDRAAGVGGGGGEHGRSGPLPGQRLCGAAVADGQVRRHLPVALRGRAAVTAGAGALLRVLQRGASAPSPRLPDTGGRVSGGTSLKEVGGVKGAFFFAPHSLSPGEGSAVRKRMPWSRAEDKRCGRAEFSSTV